MFEIGTSLREARTRQGVDLLEAEQATKIRSKYLRALEDERFELLPAQTYVKGFLRSYADYLGLDGQLYVDEYNSRYVPGEDEAPLRSRRAGQSQAHRRVESSVLLVTVAGIAVVTALVIVAWKWGGSTPPTTPAAVPSLGTTAAQDSPLPGRAGAPWSKLELTAGRGGSHVVVYRRRCGAARARLLYEGTLERGQTRTFTGLRLCVQATRPDNLVSRVNGRLARLPGDGSSPIVADVSSAGIADATAS